MWGWKMGWVCRRIDRFEGPSSLIAVNKYKVNFRNNIKYRIEIRGGIWLMHGRRFNDLYVHHNHAFAGYWCLGCYRVLILECSYSILLHCLLKVVWNSYKIWRSLQTVDERLTEGMALYVIGIWSQLCSLLFWYLHVLGAGTTQQFCLLCDSGSKYYLMKSKKLWWAGFPTATQTMLGLHDS